MPWETNNISVDSLVAAPFLIQPGVVYYNNLRAWNGALLSVQVSSIPFMILRPSDKLIEHGQSGEFLITSPTHAVRRSLNFSSFSASMFVEVPVGAIDNNTFLSLMPLSYSDVTALYTDGVGSQMDVMQRTAVIQNMSTFVHDPNDFPSYSRVSSNFTGMTFAISIANVISSNFRVLPLVIGATTKIFWNMTSIHPRWMYWDIAKQMWLFASTTCGSNYHDSTSIDPRNNIINITTEVRSTNVKKSNICVAHSVPHTN